MFEYKSSNRVPNGLGLLAMIAIVSMAVFTPRPLLAATKIEKTFGGWLVTCVEDKGAKRCAMGQSRIEAKSKRVVLAWSVAKTGKGEIVNVIVVPTGVSIPEGVSLAVGEQKPVTLGYSVCGPRACQASVDLGAGALSSGGSISVNYVRANKQLVQGKIDLKGYAEALEYFSQQSQ